MQNFRHADVIDNYHGTLIADPFRWLENPTDPDTIKFIDSQVAKTRSFLDEHPVRSEIYTRISNLWNYEKYFTPHKNGKAYYYLFNKGLNNQPDLYCTESLETPPHKGQKILDINGLSPDGTKALSIFSPSPNNKFVAYGISTNGSDWQDIAILDLESNCLLPDSIKWCKFTPLAWLPDDSGFLYSRYPAVGSVAPEDESCYNRVYLHHLNTPQENDILLAENKQNKFQSFRPLVTPDGKYILLSVSQGSASGNQIYYRALDDNTTFKPLITIPQTLSVYLGNRANIFYFLTNVQAPCRQIVAIDISKPETDKWLSIIPEQQDLLAQAIMVNNHFVVASLHNAYHKLDIYDITGKHVQNITLPTLGAITTLSGGNDDKEFFFDFSSFLYPQTIWRYDFSSSRAEVLWQPKLDFDFEQYETYQIMYPSKDGTKIPMFLSHKKGIVKDGQNPTLLYGYGGFNIARLPEFKIPDIVWMERGGVFAVANLRGGSEFGEAWHQAGMLERKQNVFDDFIAGAEFLIQEKYTSSQKLAIKGRSNGGLLTAACMLQRPDLFGAVISQVPVIDMLRYHKFTVGRFWIPEYGDAEHNPEHFKFMLAYSPLHNVRFGHVYPPIMIMTAKTDDRVVPAHSFKFAATLQSVSLSNNPILLRVEFGAGHGGGKPTQLLINEQTDVYTFLDKMLN